MTGTTTSLLQVCLQRFLAKDSFARSELMDFARRRLKELADRMFVRFKLLNALEHSDDLFQEAMIRLLNSLDEVKPATVKEFMGLAALQMRRALRDMARKHYGRSKGVNPDEIKPLIMTTSYLPSVVTHAESHCDFPEMMLVWAEFHEAADGLPEPERTAFNLLYYGELPQGDVAEIMGVSDRQVRRYWQSARRTVGRQVDGFWPEA